jgi:SAM-dependent methyltransferase
VSGVVGAVCPVCGTKEASVLWKENLPPLVTAREFSYSGNKRYHGPVLRCASCRHRFVHPLPVALDDMYRDVEDEFYLKTEPARRATFAEFLDLKERFCPQRGRLLDIGCYTGVLLEVAGSRGYDVEGMELSRWASAIAGARGYRVHQCSLGEFPASSPAYDTITAFDVLEHLPEPVTAVRTIHRLLKPGGCFVATVPDMGCWHARLLGSRHWMVVVMHLQYFVRATLHRLLKEAGFDRCDIVPAPPYRLRLKDAYEYARNVPALRFPFMALSHTPGINRLELRLTAGLFCIAWK